MAARQPLDLPDLGEQKVLFSKFSIALTSLVFTPLFGGYLYCANLHYSGQKSKIFGTYVAILFGNFLTSVIWWGMEDPIPFDFSLEPRFLDFSLINIIPAVVMTLLMIGPMWKRHFGDLEFRTVFPSLHVIVMAALFGLYYFYTYALQINFQPYEPRPFYLIQLNKYQQLLVLPLLLVVRVFYLIVVRISGIINRRKV